MQNVSLQVIIAYTFDSFQPVTPSLFRVGSKLESVDKKNNNLVCVSTVVDTMGDKVLVHFDGWEDTYDYWCDVSSPNILPVGWCEEQGLPLNPPCGKLITVNQFLIPKMEYF